MANNQYLGQRIAVDRAALQRKELSFYVPPLDTVTTMLSSGEFFHVRSQICIRNSKIENCGHEKLRVAV